MTWTAESMLAVAKCYPGLSLRADGTLVGRLPIIGALVKGGLILNPATETLEDAEARGSYILDDFKVEIGMEHGRPFLRVPESRFAETAAAESIPLVDLHLYSDQTACTSSPQELESDLLRGLEAEDFVGKYVLPFLYGQAYRTKFGRWPWPELSHGARGLLEWLGRHPSPTKEDVWRTAMSILRLQNPIEGLTILSSRARPYGLCPCKSGRRLRDCHPEIKTAIDAIRGAAAQGQLDVVKEALLVFRRHRPRSPLCSPTTPA